MIDPNSILRLSVIIVSFGIVYFFFRRKKLLSFLTGLQFMVAWFVMSIFIYFVFCYGFVGSFLIKTYAWPRPFASLEWKAREWKIGDATRAGMTNDLVKSKLLDGKTKEDVIDLLGKPISVDANSKTIEYFLGSRRIFWKLGGGSEVLRISFENGVVDEYEIRELISD